MRIRWLLLLPLLSACDNPTEPRLEDIAGVYGIATVNGETPPFQFVGPPVTPNEGWLCGAELQIARDGFYSLTLQLGSIYEAEDPEPYIRSDEGTVTMRVGRPDFVSHRGKTIRGISSDSETITAEVADVRAAGDAPVIRFSRTANPNAWCSAQVFSHRVSRSMR